MVKIGQDQVTPFLNDNKITGQQQQKPTAGEGSLMEKVTMPGETTIQTAQNPQTQDKNAFQKPGDKVYRNFQA